MIPELPPSPPTEWTPTPPIQPSWFAPTPRPLPTPPRRNRSRALIAAACIGGFAVGAAGMAFVQQVRGNNPLSAVAASVPNKPAMSTPTTPASPSSTSGAPRATTPTTPTTTPQAQAPSRASSEADLTVGIVNINTVLAFQQAEAAGTGIVLKSSGEILTNNHVIDGATKITVTVIATGHSYAAKVIGTDASDDIAVLQLDNASGLATAPLGDSSTVKIGDAVVGLGNAGGTGTPTSSAGSVLNLGQTITATDQGGANAETLHDLIEISAQLQPGQSGGPLYDAAGKVVGIDSAGSVSRGFRGRSSSTGAGYAIPINDALTIAHAIESGKASDTITVGTPPLLGISVAPAADTTDGVTVTGVTPSTPAAKLGLQVGDVITAIDGTHVASPAALSKVLRTHKVGDKVAVTWTRDGVTHSGTAITIAGPAN